jgi:hypothetical protein
MVAVNLDTRQEDGSPEKSMLNPLKENLTTLIGINNIA